MDSPTRILVAEVHGLAGREGELRALLDALAEAAREEPGCVSFWEFPAKPSGEQVIVSAWADDAALRAHYATPHYRRYREAVPPLLARPSDVVVHHVSDTVHALDPAPPDPARLGQVAPMGDFVSRGFGGSRRVPGDLAGLVPTPDVDPGAGEWSFSIDGMVG